MKDLWISLLLYLLQCFLPFKMRSTTKKRRILIMHFRISYWCAKLTNTRKKKVIWKLYIISRIFQLFYSFLGESSFSNDEDIIFSSNAECSFEYDVSKDSDTAVGGKWKSNEEELLPCRKVLLISADKLQDILTQINTFVQMWFCCFFCA